MQLEFVKVQTQFFISSSFWPNEYSVRPLLINCLEFKSDDYRILYLKLFLRKVENFVFTYSTNYSIYCRDKTD